MGTSLVRGATLPFVVWLLVAGCSRTDVEGAPPAQSTGGELSHASARSRELLRAVQGSRLAGFPTRPTDRAAQPCEPAGAGRQNYVASIEVEVPAPSVNQVVAATWSELSRLGFVQEAGQAVPTTGRGAPMHASGILDGYVAAVSGSRDRGLVFVSITTPCL